MPQIWGQVGRLHCCSLPPCLPLPAAPPARAAAASRTTHLRSDKAARLAQLRLERVKLRVAHEGRPPVERQLRLQEPLLVAAAATRGAGRARDTF